MASVLNYLKANFMLAKKPMFIGVESDRPTSIASDKLLFYSLAYNEAFSEKVKLIIDLHGHSGLSREFRAAEPIQQGEYSLRKS